MNIPIYKNINSLLQANGPEVKSGNSEFSISQIRRTKGSGLKRKAHRTEFYGLTFIESGQGKICINNNCYEFEDNMLIATSPGQIITLEVDNISYGYTIFFTSEFLNEHYPETIEKKFPFYKLNADSLPVINKDGNHFKILFRAINVEYHTKEPEYMNIIRSYLLVLLNLANRHYLKKTDTSNFRNKKYELTVELERLVAQNMPERKSITYLAKKLSVSSKHLSEIVKATTGKTPSAFITNIYMLEAKKLLMHTSLSIIEVAYQLNYDDPSYFNKVFKRQFNMTPLHFKKQLVR
ncbi:MAG: AraC family transcriptional regulator [Rhizobacter sp.]|nr:AraC family transcriptional regulator [Ferruginibacter sp.]